MVVVLQRLEGVTVMDWAKDAHPRLEARDVVLGRMRVFRVAADGAFRPMVGHFSHAAPSFFGLHSSHRSFMAAAMKRMVYGRTPM